MSLVQDSAYLRCTSIGPFQLTRHVRKPYLPTGQNNHQIKLNIIFNTLLHCTTTYVACNHG